jgi:hypothetical protein
METNVEYQISTSLNEGILEILLTGEESQSNVAKMKNEIDSIIINSAVKNVLIDCRALRERLGITKTYERVRSYAPEIYKVKIVLIDLPEHADYQKFHETTALNAGMRFKWFTDADDARTWLKGK